MFFRILDEFDEFKNTFPNNYAVQGYYGQYGIIYFEQSHHPEYDTPIETAPPLNWVIEPFYDNIVRWGNDFVLCKHGKLGAVHCEGDTVKWIAPCEYDTVGSNGGVLLLSKYGEQRCYFRMTDTVKSYTKIDFCGPEDRYICATDTQFYYIIDCYSRNASDAVLWSCAKEDSRLSPWCLFNGAPCFVYMGETDGLPMFLDCSNGNYIVPNGKNKLDLAPAFPNTITPIIVQGKNIVNITDDTRKVNAGSFKECIQQNFEDSEGFDEVTVEIKVTLKSQTRTEERCYPIPRGRFVSGDIVDLWEWYT